MVDLFFPNSGTSSDKESLLGETNIGKGRLCVKGEGITRCGGSALSWGLGVFSMGAKRNAKRRFSVF